MALKFDFSTTRIPFAGKYIIIIKSIKDVTIDNGNKIAVKAVPVDENGIYYEEETLWFDMVAKKRERSFWEALGCPDDLEECVGMRVGANVTLNEKNGNTYVNMNTFFEVEQEDEFMEVDSDDIPFE